MSIDLESELRNYADTSDYHTDSVFFAKAADHIKAQRELIQELIGTLEVCERYLSHVGANYTGIVHGVLSKAKSQQEEEAE